jgi:Fe-S-cluster-containing dehydrogenase component
MTERDVRLQRIRVRNHREFELSRRSFMQLVGASAAVSFASGCAPDAPEKILPYVQRPLDVTPGKSTHYATSLLLDGFATGLIVETREGRPIKVEGNLNHPASLGATSIYHQAAVLQLYDPDRAKAVLAQAEPTSWRALERALRRPDLDQGEGMRVLLEPTSSPLIQTLCEELKQRYPRAKLTFYTPLPAQAPSQASFELFGQRLTPHYDLSRARVVVVLDADILATPFELRYAREFAARRHLTRAGDTMNRLYAVEAAPSVTGSMADHRLRRPSAHVARIAAALLSELSQRALPHDALDPDEQRFVSALMRDLKNCGPGQTLVIAGDRQPLDVHVLAYAINHALGNLGRTLRLRESVVDDGAGDQDLPALSEEMQRGAVNSLIVVGANPSYDAPVDLDWSRAMRRVPLSLHCGLYYNETSRDAGWFAPLAHPFEAWGDGRAYDGTLSFIQPLIRSLSGGKTVSEILALLAGQNAHSDHTRLRARFGESFGEKLNAAMSPAERSARELPVARTNWETALAQGFVSNSALSDVSGAFEPRAARVSEALNVVLTAAKPAGLEINFLRSPTLHDGRFANLAWLLELPDPISKLTWDNAALISPATAARLAIPRVEPEADRPMIALTHAGRTLRVPVLVLPGHADDSISIWLGYGRKGSERLARGVGQNAYQLRTQADQHFAFDLQVRVLSETFPLAITQLHHDMLDRPLALSASVSAYRAEPNFTAQYKGALPSLMPEFELPGPQWAMSIDLGMCIGCNACVVACQAENNVLTVGKEQVSKGRVMHWLRIDTYYKESKTPFANDIIHQPMACQHCEKAPCEYVCPVNATEHSPDGLNEMVYNRCVGTRFCSNNCPYKVRRFNWFNWVEHEPANHGSVALQRNPEVTVRARGVMEKCTYCVQRIRSAEIDARIERREIASGEVVTACQQACPTGAITFGSLTDPAATTNTWRTLDRSHAVLHETGARPRTMYLARISNPNPELA